MLALPSKLGVLLLAVFVAVVVNKLSSFDGSLHDGKRPIPFEAVPMYKQSEMIWFCRFVFGYLFAHIAPVGTMVACPTTVDIDNEEEAANSLACMEKGRSIETSDLSMDDLSSSFDVENLLVGRPDGGPEMEITLLTKKNSGAARDDSILLMYLHGGGFTVRGGKNMFSHQIFSEMLKQDDELMGRATYAIVKYRLAPFSQYPDATNDSMLALEYLVKTKNLGNSGIHIIGQSAGATLAMEVTLRSISAEGLSVDSFLVDEPMVPLPRSNSNNGTWAFDSDSFRRYAWTSMPSTRWLEWSLMAYSGFSLSELELSTIPIGMVETPIDITGGALSPEKWTKAVAAGGVPELPHLLLVTALGDPLRSGGQYFKQVYEQVLRETKSESKLSYMEAVSGHANLYIFEPGLFKRLMTAFLDNIRSVRRQRRFREEQLQTLNG